MDTIIINGNAHDAQAIKAMMLQYPVVSVSTNTLEKHPSPLETKELVVLAYGDKHLIIGTNGRSDLDKKDTVKARLVSHYLLKKTKIVPVAPRHDSRGSGAAPAVEYRSRKPFREYTEREY